MPNILQIFIAHLYFFKNWLCSHVVVAQSLNQVLGRQTQMIFEFRIIPEDYVISVFNQPFGAFVTFALLAAALAGYKNAKTAKAEKKKKAQEAAQAALAKEAK